jgi:hypothetical protein
MLPDRVVSDYAANSRRLRAHQADGVGLSHVSVLKVAARAA